MTTNANDDEVVVGTIWFDLTAAMTTAIRRMAAESGCTPGNVLERLVESGLRREIAMRRKVRMLIRDAGGQPQA